MSTKIIFPKYYFKEVVGDKADIELEALPLPIKLDLTRWSNEFRNRCDEQLRQVSTKNGTFIEARLKGSGHYNGALPYGRSVIYNTNEDPGEVHSREYLLEATNFTLISQVSRETTGKITKLDIKSPKSSIEDALILELLKDGLTLEQLAGLYIREPMFFTNEIPATWHAMRDNGDTVETISFHTRWRDILLRGRKRLFGVQRNSIKK